MKELKFRKFLTSFYLLHHNGFSFKNWHSFPGTRFRSDKKTSFLLQFKVEIIKVKAWGGLVRVCLEISRSYTAVDRFFDKFLLFKWNQSVQRQILLNFIGVLLWSPLLQRLCKISSLCENFEVFISDGFQNQMQITIPLPSFYPPVKLDQQVV